jgi:archaetidylinositol phosphate synthase
MILPMHPWRERLDRALTPLAARSPLSANQITVLALGLNLVAAALLAMAARDYRLFLVAPAVVAVAGLLDAFDGIVARARNQSTRFGDFLDHLCDRISDAALMAGWILGTSIRPWLGFVAIIAVMMTGYVGTQIEATFRIRSYEGVGRGEYVLALVALPILAFTAARLGVLTTPFAGFTIPEWLLFLLIAAALWAIVRRAGAARHLQDAE